MNNPDVDLRVVNRILEESEEEDNVVNFRVTPSSLKWKLALNMFSTLYSMGLNTSAFVEYFAPFLGATALHLALLRGDVDLIELLLDHGADPRIKDGLGRCSFEYLKIYGPFPKVNGLMNRATMTLIKKESTIASMTSPR